MNIKEFIATGFYTGLIPIAPGTMGSIAAAFLSIIVAIYSPLENTLDFVLLAIIFSALTLYAGGAVADATGNKDPGIVVMDEFAGMALTLSFVSISVTAVAAAFLLFRIFDIVKPYPVSSLQNIPGAMGILLDDLAAALFAGAFLIALRSMHWI